MFVIVPFIAGAIVGGLVIAFWDEIKEWAQNLLGYVISAMNTALEVISDAYIYIVKQSTHYYKRFEVYKRNLQTNKYESHIEQKEISESEVPDEIKEQLEMRGKDKIKIMQRATSL